MQHLKSQQQRQQTSHKYSLQIFDGYDDDRKAKQLKIMITLEIIA